MAATRQNRFRRRDRTFHSPLADTASTDRDGDLELGPAHRHAQPWTDEHDGEAFAASESEAMTPPGKMPLLRLPPNPQRMGTISKMRRKHIVLSGLNTKPRHGKRRRFPSRTVSRFWSLIRMILMTLGILQCVTFLCGVLEAAFPDEMDLVSGPFKDSFVPTGLPDSQWRDDITQLTADVQPFMCHSHNDYWRREPLYQAIHAGCTGVEADVWLLADQLYVSHTTSGIRLDRTLETLYLDPLMKILDQKNLVPDFLEPETRDATLRMGVFDANPKQNLVLLIDFKNKPEEMWHRVSSLLAPFRARKYLTYFNGSDVVNGPLTVVLSGHACFDRIVENATYRDIFYDAPLDTLASVPAATLPTTSISNVHKNELNSTESPALSSSHPAVKAAYYSPFNSYYASTSFKRSIGHPFHSSLTQAQLQKIRSQIRIAHAMGLQVRYWGIPAWPIGVRNYLWRVLVREGVDYLSVDDIDDVRSKNWGPRKGGWGKKWWR